MREVRDWPAHLGVSFTDPDHNFSLGGWNGTVNPKLPPLYEKLVAALSAEERELLMEEIACCTEQAYRRGYQQGQLWAGQGCGATQLELADWRFDTPLERNTCPPHSHGYGCSSVERLAMEAGNCSGLIDQLCIDLRIPC